MQCAAENGHTPGFLFLTYHWWACASYSKSWSCSYFDTWCFV